GVTFRPDLLFKVNSMLIAYALCTCG
ncbi:hypothetical protein A2U01_0110404, partial [Trifolium medium]|nr:hypothetical protein [Trifolium medium]